MPWWGWLIVIGTGIGVSLALYAVLWFVVLIYGPKGGN